MNKINWAYSKMTLSVGSGQSKYGKSIEILNLKYRISMNNDGYLAHQ